MRSRRKKRTLRSIGRGVLLLVIPALLICFFIHTETALRPAAQKQAESFARRRAELVIGRALADYLSEHEYECGDFAAVLYDESGRAVSVESLTYNINRVQSELAVLIDQRLDECSSDAAKIPLGTLSGLYLLTGKGPSVRVRVCPVGSVSVTLESSFSSAGINQTCHRISARITAELSSQSPLYSFETQQSFEFLMSETVIVGDVPEMPMINGRSALSTQ